MCRFPLSIRDKKGEKIGDFYLILLAFCWGLELVYWVVLFVVGFVTCSVEYTSIGTVSYLDSHMDGLFSFVSELTKGEFVNVFFELSYFSTFCNYFYESL